MSRPQSNQPQPLSPAPGFRPDPSQAAVIECRDHLCVVAGAGSGKTGTLVEALCTHLAESMPRIGNAPPQFSGGLNASAEPLEITDILALTFTEKAAAELRARLGRSFQLRRKQAADEKSAQFWRRQSARLDRADIGTIHSYALKLIRENSLRLGLAAPPSLDDKANSLSRDLGNIFVDLLDQGDQDLLALLPLYSRQTLCAMLEKCAERSSSWGLAGFTADLKPPTGDLAALIGQYKGLAAEALNFVVTGGLDPKKDYYHKVLKAMTALNEALATDDPSADLPARLRLWNRLEKSGGDWRTKDGRAMRKALQASAEKIWQFVCDQAAAPVKEKFLALAEKATKLLAAEKRRRGVISFDDVLILARRLMAENPAVRQREAARHKLVVVDEFQDTNRLQADLLAYLLLPPGDENVYEASFPIRDKIDWGAASNRFSVFGDIKQSIYRFRGAEVEIMAGLKNDFTLGRGQALALSGNYRSQPPLVDFFNTLFAEHLESFSGQDLQSARREALYQGPHVTLLRSLEDSRPRGRERARRQGLALARYLADLFSGKFGVMIDDGSPAGRRPEPGDVAVLFRRFKWAGVFKEALVEAGWQCRLAVGDNPFEYSEVKGLVAALQYLYGVDLELSLAAMLRSPLGPLSDEALAALAWPGDCGKAKPLSAWFQKQSEPPAGLSPYDRKIFLEIRKLLLELAPLTGRVRPVEILERLAEERNLPALAIMEADGQNRLKALTSFLALSRGLGRSRENIPGVVEELKEMMDQWDPKRNNAEPDPGSQAINLMTVHASKGLEFPVVVLAESDAGLSGHHTPVMIAPDGTLALQYQNEFGEWLKPSDFKALEAEEKELETRENARLFYVAATRAKDHLVFLGWPKPEKKSSKPDEGKVETIWLEALLKQPLAAEKCGLAEYDLDDENAPAAARPENSAPAPDAPKNGPCLIAPMSLNDYSLSVTALSRILAEPEADGQYLAGLSSSFPAETFKPPLNSSDALPLRGTDAPSHDEKRIDVPSAFAPWSPGKPFFEISPPPAEQGPKALPPDLAGTLFHAVLENINPLKPEIEKLLQQEAAGLGLNPGPEEMADLSRRITVFLDQPIGRLWRESLELGCPDFRELPFRLNLPLKNTGGRLALTGTIDLLFIDKNGRAQIVDYKLAELHPGPRLAAYENQVKIYAQAIKSSGWLLPANFGGALPLRGAEDQASQPGSPSPSMVSATIYFAGGPKQVVLEVPIDQDEPIRPVLNEIYEKFSFIKNTRPLRPVYPAALNIV